jgi:hypothetical protein
MNHVLDGNAAAGTLAEVFAAEMTVAMSTCVACGDNHPIGELRAYLDAPGVVLRCPSCDAVQIRFVRGPQQAWLDVRGVRVLQFSLAGSARA